MQLVKGEERFAPDLAGFRRPILDGGEGPVRVYAYAGAAGEDCAYHCHASSVELFVVMEGQGVIVVDGDEVPLSRGDTLIVDPGEFHLVRTGDAPFHLLCVVAPNVDDLVMDTVEPVAAGT